MRLIGLKNPIPDGGLLVFIMGIMFYVGVAPDLRDISSRKGILDMLRRSLIALGPRF